MLQQHLDIVLLYAPLLHSNNGMLAQHDECRLTVELIMGNHRRHIYLGYINMSRFQAGDPGTDDTLLPTAKYATSIDISIEWIDLGSNAEFSSAENSSAVEEAPT